MKYNKPVIIAQGKSNGSYAAGCPANKDCGIFGNSSGGLGCKNCERTK